METDAENLRAYVLERKRAMREWQDRLNEDRQRAERERAARLLLSRLLNQLMHRTFLSWAVLTAKRRRLRPDAATRVQAV
eukprot:SAG22_NODE_15888_length_338_cov_0.543933_1_plen_79_part_10